MEIFIRQRKAALKSRRARISPPPVTTWYLDAYVEHLDSSPIYREAQAWHALLSHIGLPIYPEESITGGLLHSEAAMFHYGSGTYVVWEHAERYIRENRLSPEEEAGFRARLDLLETHRYSLLDAFPPDEQASIEAHAASSTWFGGHMILDYERILSIGLRGYALLIEECRQAGKAEFYDAMSVMLDAIRIFIRRYAAGAGECALLDGWDRNRTKAMAADLTRIADRPPETFRQALQLVWILHLLNGADSFGRFDQYIRPFYERDIREGALDRDGACRLLADFIVKIEEANQIQNMTIGGVAPDGSPAYSDLTVDILDMTRMVGYKGPNLALRVTGDVPDMVWDAALACIGSGIGLPALYNDSIYISALTGRGVPPEEANNFSLAGCSQVMVPGKCNFYNDVGLMNAAKILELTLYDGYDPRTGRQVGPHTGKPESFASFDAFYAAFCAQVDYFCDMEGRINNRETALRAAREGYAMRTLLIADCLEKGLSIFEGGARFNNIELEIIGLTNAADSLYAIKMAVYDDRIICLRELADVLLSDYDGADSLRRKLLAYDKFGNDCDEVDRMRARIAGRFYRRLAAIPSIIGGVMVPGEVIFISHEYEGAVTGATPDGRRVGTVLADSAGSSQGMDRRGPTALLNSVLKIPTGGCLLTSVVTNLKFTQALYGDNTQKIRWLLAAFFRQGGMQVQINVTDNRVLEDAIRHPEQYRSLIVRVGGYSDYFVNLSPALQREIICRTAQPL